MIRSVLVFADTEFETFIVFTRVVEKEKIRYEHECHRDVIGYKLMYR